MIPDTFIQDLLHRVDIVDVVGRYVKLKRAGANYSACCPFHSEKTPSFTVSPTKQFYHCFGCGAHGTAIGFLMEYVGVGFVEAVKDLAQNVGMTVPEVRSESAERAAGSSGHDLHGVLLQAARFYRAQLKNAEHAIAYLKQRGLSGEIAKRFGIGYAPDAWQGLAGAFEDYGGKALAAAGLVKETDEGKRYDVFRNRIMFPIVDVRGNVIGFGGRVLDPGTPAQDGKGGGPKYLNSPETAVFEKGRELYGLYQARRAIHDAGRAVVVEGYMDVVALAQHGIDYAVATLGTATTPIHVQKLLRQTDEIVFCFDGDDAGRRAAWRALENSLSQLADGKRIAFLFLPQGEDPDTYVRAHGKAAFEALLRQSLPLSRYFLETLSQRVDLSSAEGRAALIHAAKPLVKLMPPSSFRMQVVNELARTARLAPQEVEQLCELAPVSPRKQAAAMPARSTRPSPPALCKRLLRLLVNAPGLNRKITAERRSLLQAQENLEPVLELLDILEGSGANSTAGLTEAAKGSVYAPLYHEAAGDGLLGEMTEENAVAQLEGEFIRLELQRVAGEYEALKNRKLETEADRRRFMELGKRLAELKGAAAV